MLSPMRPSVISVSTPPEAMALTVMPYSAHSMAAWRVSAVAAPLLPL